jgi:hypothetical protein
MAMDRKSEFDNLYKQAQNILLHEMTQEEQSFVAELAWENHAAMSEDRLSRLRQLVKNKGNRPSVA